MRARGVGCQPDRAVALGWLNKAAELGDVSAQTQLAYLHSSGRGGATRDDAKALRWYRAAADAGDAEALYKLGVMLRQGVGCDADQDAALRCWRAAAEAGHAKAAERVRAFGPVSPPPPPNSQIGERPSVLDVFCSCWRKPRQDQDVPKSATESPLVEPLIDAAAANDSPAAIEDSARADRQEERDEDPASVL